MLSVKIHYSRKKEKNNDVIRGITSKGRDLSDELLQTLVVMVFYATTCSARSTSKILWSLIPSAGFENVKRFIPFPTFSLELDRACASVSREAILSRQRLVKNFTFGTCLFTHISHWLTWRARPLRDGQKGNKKHLSCNIAAEGVEKRCCAFYHPYQTCVATNQVVNRFDWRASWNGQHRFQNDVVVLCCLVQCSNAKQVTRFCALFSRFRAPSFPFSLPHQPSATKDRRWRWRGGGS